MKKKHLLGLFVLIVLIIFLSGCKEEPIVTDDTGSTTEGVENIVNANNEFAFDFYSNIKKQGENIFFSPYSLSAALSMTYEGARGQTAEEMQSVLHIPEDPNLRRPNFAKIYNEINKKDKDYKLSTANALWAQNEFTFLQEYFNTIDQYYGGRVTNLDFVKETEKSRQIINNWVEDQTNNKIKDLLPKSPPVLTSDTRLVLTNAIYFKGDWVLKFDKKKTRDADFRISPGETIQVPMMSLTGEKAKFNYAETEELQILEMPYEGEELSMLVLLPKEDNLRALEESLNAESLEQWKSQLHETQMDVYLPKFKFETKYSLPQTLAKMGMPTAFQWPGADFSGMDGTRNLFISNVIHQAYVEVNEEGTEAAAATAIVMTLGSAMPNYFRADHPFIFIIQERTTGGILFLGKVVDPR